MLSRFAPFRIALSGAKGLTLNSAKHPRICEIKEIRRSFVVPPSGTPQDDSFRDFFRNLFSRPGVSTLSFAGHFECGAELAELPFWI
jgi:hypothetical protein